MGIARNRLKYLIIIMKVMGEYACYALNLVTVPLYDTLGDDAIVHICNQTEMKVAIVSVQKVSYDVFGLYYNW